MNKIFKNQVKINQNLKIELRCEEQEERVVCMCETTQEKTQSQRSGRNGAQKGSEGWLPGQGVSVRGGR